MSGTITVSLRTTCLASLPLSIIVLGLVTADRRTDSMSPRRQCQPCASSGRPIIHPLFERTPNRPGQPCRTGQAALHLLGLFSRVLLSPGAPRSHVAASQLVLLDRREPVFTPRLFSLHIHNADVRAILCMYSNGKILPTFEFRTGLPEPCLEFVTSEQLALCASKLDRIVNTKSSPATNLTRWNGLRGQRRGSERKVFLLWYTRLVRA